MSTGSFEFVSPKTYENGKHMADRSSNKENEAPVIPPETSSLLSRSSHTDTSNENSWQIELKKGIGHLNALLDANEMDTKTKKRQMRKIVLALFSAKYPMHTESGQASTSTSASKRSSCLSEKQAVSGVQTIASSSASGDTVSDNRPSKSPLNAKPQQSSIKSTMKDWLQPMTHSEIDFQHHLARQHQIENGQQEMIKKLLDAQQHKQSNEGRTKIDWIDEEMGRLAMLKARIMNENVSTDIVYENIRRRQSETAPPTAQRVGQQLSHAHSLDSKHIVAAAAAAAEPKKPTDRHNPSEWNSHKTYSKTASASRTKLQTPATDLRADNGIAAYAHEKRKQFINKYDTNHGKLYGDDRQQQQQQDIYTQPSSEHYSDARDISKTKSSPSRVMKNDAYTSIVGSDTFLSSNSVSVPGGINSSSHTTTHQYDTRASVAIQTSDSLRRTAPIFGAQHLEQGGRCECKITECVCSCKRTTDVRRQRRTIRVAHTQNDKQQQTIPEPVAYVLTFDTGTAGLNAAPPPPLLSGSGSSSSTMQSSAADSKLTLRQHLQNRRPDVVRKAEDRRQCLQEIHNLR